MKNWGWNWLERAFLKAIEKYNKDNPDDPLWALATESYGCLRLEGNFYGVDDLFYLADALCDASAHVCIDCGAPGHHITIAGWILPLCEACEELRVAQWKEWARADDECHTPFKTGCKPLGV
jgi:hypothetical protein